MVAELHDPVLAPKIRVVLADDHPAVLANIRSTLGSDFEVVAAVNNGNKAIDAVRLWEPDVLVIDISMPILDGLQAAKSLRNANCRAKIVFLTIHEDPDFVAAALSAGACGYVLKPRLATDLVLAIREAMLGHTFVSRH